MFYADRDTATGKIINSYLTNTANVEDKVIHKLFSDNRWEFKYVVNACAAVRNHATHTRGFRAKPCWICYYLGRDEIINTLNEGKSIVVDRYAFSGVCATLQITSLL